MANSNVCEFSTSKLFDAVQHVIKENNEILKLFLVLTKPKKMANSNRNVHVFPTTEFFDEVQKVVKEKNVFLKTTDIVYKWEIENFSTQTGTETWNGASYIRSSDFSANEEPVHSSCKCFTCIENQWTFHLELFPNGFKAANFVSVRLHIDNCHLNSRFITYKIVIIDGEGNECRTSCGNINCSEMRQKCPTGFLNYRDICIPRDYLLNPANKFLQNDKLVLLCEIQVLQSTTRSAAIDQINVDNYLMTDFALDAAKKTSKSHTSSSVSDFSHEWIIENFKYALDSKLNSDLNLSSKPFLASNNSKVAFVMQLNLFGSSKEYVSAFIALAPQQEDIKVRILYRIWIEKSNGAKFNMKEDRDVVSKNNPIGYQRYIRLAQLMDNSNSLLLGNDLKICCQIRYISNWETKSDQSEAQYSGEESCIQQNLLDLWKSEKYSDITLIANGREFKAHKIILASRSEYFEHLIAHSSSSGESNQIQIKDIEADVLEEILRFIYSDRVENLDIYAQELIIQADKLCLNSLKTICEDYICEHNILTEDTALRFLAYAHLHKAWKLKAEVIRFINQYESIIDSEEYLELCKSSPELAQELHKKGITKYLEVNNEDSVR